MAGMLFLDTSGLVRRYYRAEPGASRVRAASASSSQQTILVARLAPVEFIAALSRRVRDGTLPPGERDRHLKAFWLHWRDQYEVVPLTEQVFAEAEHLVYTYPLRSLDALQLASALLVSARLSRLARFRLSFWTADAQQARAAEAEGLTVEFLG